jgi:hypothetical protein
MRLVATALFAAASSAAIVAALTMTPLGYFRWLIALAVPLAVSFELYWGAGGYGAEVDASPETAAAQIVACLVSGIAASCMVAWLLGRRAVMYAPSSISVARTGKPLVLLGLGLFATFIAGVRWLFRPGNDPRGLAGGLVLELAAPLTLLLATALLILGTLRLLEERSTESQSAKVTHVALGIAGVLASAAGITLCLNIAADFALG